MVPMLLSTIVWANSTPQAAALRVVAFGMTKPPIVRRVNIVGRYATVLTSGVRIGSDTLRAPVLVEHFSFGWQALDLLNFKCNLESHKLPRSVEAALMRGMPKPQDDSPCNGLRDAGRAADVAAVRALMGTKAFIPWVVVAGDWAMGQWYSAPGGETLFRRRGGVWKRVDGGGGAFGVPEMRRDGVPQADWCKFNVYNAKCPS